MSSYVVGFQDVDRTRIAAVGGKGANLGELSRVEGLHVPEGFCVSTAAFERVVAGAIAPLLDRLSRLTLEDREAIKSLSAEIRAVI